MTLAELKAEYVTVRNDFEQTKQPAMKCILAQKLGELTVLIQRKEHKIFQENK